MIKIGAIIAIACLGLILFSSLASAAIWGSDTSADFSFSESSDDGDDGDGDDGDGDEKEKHGLPNVRIIDEDEEYKQWLGLYDSGSRSCGGSVVLSDSVSDEEVNYGWLGWFNIVLGLAILLLIIVLLLVFLARR